MYLRKVISYKNGPFFARLPQKGDFWHVSSERTKEKLKFRFTKRLNGPFDCSWQLLTESALRDTP